MSPSRGRHSPDSAKRVVLYVRVSALMNRGGDDFHSPAVQLTSMRRLTAGLREVAVIEDLDRTGRHFDREGIAKVRAMAERREIDALAVYDVSRLGRNVRESLAFLAELAELGVTILSACEQVDTSTPAGRLMLTNMLAIAEYRSDEIGRSWSAAIARKAGQGHHHGKAMGYAKKGGPLTVHPVEGPAMTEAFRSYAAGLPMHQICKDLADAIGRPVHAGNLKARFRRQVYLGHASAAGDVVVRDAHPPLVNQATWDKAQQRLAQDATTPSRNLQVTWALVGVTFCGECKARLQRNSRVRRGVLEDRLICGNGPGRSARGCQGIGGPLMDEVQVEVLRQAAMYVEKLRTDDVARAERLARRTATATDVKASRRRLKQVREALVRLVKARALGEVRESEYQAVAGELRDEEDSLSVRLAELDDGGQAATPEEAASAAEALLRMWPVMNVQQRNRALRALVKRVEVRRGARWREPVADRVSVKFR